MSHFVVLTLVKPEDARTRETLENKVAELLAPYDENLEVEPYRREEDDDPDYTTAKSLERMIEFYNSREEREKLYPTTYEALTGMGDGWSTGIDEDYFRSRLKSNIEEMEEIDRLLEKHGPPKADDRGSLKYWYEEHWEMEELCFDPEDGTPFVRTTYNPRSKWDFYKIGGWWTGMLAGYDPTEDIENWETCPACGGTGRLDAELGIRHREENLTYTCTGCDGTGWSVKSPSRFRDHEGNVQPVANLLHQIEGFVPDEPTAERKRENEKLPPLLPMAPPAVPPVIPYAVLTPDGEWHQRGKAGRFKMSQDEWERYEWAKTATGILAQHADCYAVVVDCHI